MKMQKQYMQAVESGHKTTTIRPGHRALGEAGERLLLEATLGECASMVVEVIRKDFTTFGALTEDMAIRDGFCSLAEFRAALQSIYPDKPFTAQDPMTIYHLKKVSL